MPSRLAAEYVNLPHTARGCACLSLADASVMAVMLVFMCIVRVRVHFTRIKRCEVITADVRARDIDPKLCTRVPTI